MKSALPFVGLALTPLLFGVTCVYVAAVLAIGWGMRMLRMWRIS